MRSGFAAIASDPGIIRGVHRYCDEWCDVCPVAARCLAHRCMGAYRTEKGRRAGDPTFRTPDEAAAFSRELAVVERCGDGHADVLPADRAGLMRVEAGEPLVRIAWQYALAVSMWLVMTPDDLRRLRIGTVPAPEEVVLWYHLRIYMKLMRAAVADESGIGSAARDEASGFAKVALVGIQRSRKALRQLKHSVDPEAIGPLETMLEALERGVDDRFPHARLYIRAGLDAPVG